MFDIPQNGFPGGTVVKKRAFSAGDVSSNPGLRRPPRGGMETHPGVLAQNPQGQRSLVRSGPRATRSQTRRSHRALKLSITAATTPPFLRRFYTARCTPPSVLLFSLKIREGLKRLVTKTTPMSFGL